MADALLHSTAVYLYAYDPQTRAYAKLSDAVVGCALLREGDGDGDGDGAVSDACKLLFYNAQKQPLLQLTLATANDAPVCTPQQDNYVTLRAADKFYSMRFKDATGVVAFLTAVAFAKAQALVVAAGGASATAPAVLVDELALGKEDAKSGGRGLAPGDVAGLALTVWRGRLGADGFFTDNPLDIATQRAAETVVRDGDLRRVRLVEGGASDSDADADDPLATALATEGLLGMHKHAKRLVTVVAPQTQQWCIASVELVKVKKATRASASASAGSAAAVRFAAAQEAEASPQPAADSAAAVNEDLVQRMASLSRAGSTGSGLIASLSARAAPQNSGGESNGASPKRLSFAELQATVAQTYVPVLLPGVQLPGERKPSAALGTVHEEEAAAPAAAPAAAEDASASPPRQSLAAKVLAPLTNPSRAHESSAPTPSMASEMERLMQEQSDLALLRQQLEESKRKLQDSDKDDAADAPAQSSSSSSRPLPVGLRHPLGVDQSRPASSPGSWQSSLPSSSASSTSLALPSAFSGTSTSRWEPPGVDPVHTYQPPPPSSYLPTPFASRSLVPAQPTAFPSSGLAPGGGGAVTEIESGVLRLQRASTSIESTLQDVQAKVDRLLNAQQHALKAGRYTTSSSSALYSSSGLSSSAGASHAAAIATAAGGASSSSSSAMLLKNLEKALAQRDELQEHSSRLQAAREQLEAAVEDLQGQHDALELENRRLLDKLQTGQQLQQDKARLELRGVQQQLGHAQQQALAYQEETFQLRRELATRDEQARQLQDDARKQLEALRRQLEAQVRQDARESSVETTALQEQLQEMAAQQQRGAQEREALASQLRAAQQQLHDERARSQAAIDAQSEAQELRAQLQRTVSESRALHQQLATCGAEKRALEELLAAAAHEAAQLRESERERDSAHEAAALGELLKEFMNDLYFHCQDAFDDDAEFTGKEVVMAVRKILKQNTMDILARLDAFWQLQAQSRGR
ncbi:hypothetical protein PybrP1_009633 [[Pythium] brassicae (nom. inval.)]|nr:hypothetical protein PybrP1_009633 [[Pythium] brassicae (nom. inval.)]